MSVTIETRIGSSRTTRINVSLPSEAVTVGGLILAKISAEWEQGGGVGREAQFPDDLANRPDARPRNLQVAYQDAIDAYRAGWYDILIDGEPARIIAQMLRLTGDEHIVFVRAYPLPGR